MRAYATDRIDLQRVRMIRDEADAMRHDPKYRNCGLAVRTETAEQRVDAALTRQEPK